MSAAQIPGPPVVYRPIAGPAPSFTLGIAQRTDAASPAVKNFVDIAVE